MTLVNKHTNENIFIFSVWKIDTTLFGGRSHFHVKVSARTNARANFRQVE